MYTADSSVSVQEWKKSLSSLPEKFQEEVLKVLGDMSAEDKDLFFSIPNRWSNLQNELEERFEKQPKQFKSHVQYFKTELKEIIARAKVGVLLLLCSRD